MDISFCHQWLKSGSDYTSGLQFYNEHGSNEAIKMLLQRGPTNFNIQKLRKAIQAIANQNPEIYLPSGSFQKNKIDRSTLPDFLQADFDKLSGLIQTISYHHSRLDLIQNDPERYNIAALILNATAERRSVFQRIDHYYQHGTDLIKPPVPKIAEVKILSGDPEVRKLQLEKELLLLRSQRSKLKNKPHRLADYNQVLDKIEAIENQL